MVPPELWRDVSHHVRLVNIPAFVSWGPPFGVVCYDLAIAYAGDSVDLVLNLFCTASSMLVRGCYELSLRTGHPPAAWAQGLSLGFLDVVQKQLDDDTPP